MRFGVAEFFGEIRKRNIFAEVGGKIGENLTNELRFVLFFAGAKFELLFDERKQQICRRAAHGIGIFFFIHPPVGDI